jgi:hypothetical protein
MNIKTFCERCNDHYSKNKIAGLHCMSCGAPMTAVNTPHEQLQEWCIVCDTCCRIPPLDLRLRFCRGCGGLTVDFL